MKRVMKYKENNNVIDGDEIEVAGGESVSVDVNIKGLFVSKLSQ